jgi:hypothetical protein
MEPTNQGEVAKQADKLSHVIQTDEGKIQTHLGEVVRGGRDILERVPTNASCTPRSAKSR